VVVSLLNHCESVLNLIRLVRLIVWGCPG